MLHLMVTLAQRSSFVTDSSMPVIKRTSLLSTISYLLLSDTFFKHNVLIIGRDMNVHIGKDRSDKFCFPNLQNRNGEYLADFSLKHSFESQNVKFQKGREKYELVPT